jgi:hypothetical protein
MLNKLYKWYVDSEIKKAERNLAFYEAKKSFMDDFTGNFTKLKLDDWRGYLEYKVKLKQLLDHGVKHEYE